QMPVYGFKLPFVGDVLDANVNAVRMNAAVGLFAVGNLADDPICAGEDFAARWCGEINPFVCGQAEACIKIGDTCRIHPKWLNNRRKLGGPAQAERHDELSL